MDKYPYPVFIHTPRLQDAGDTRIGSHGGTRQMKPEDFKRWRKSLELSQKQAAEALGLKRRVVQYYEKGERNGEKVKIPKAVRLACFALSKGVNDYDGPTKLEFQAAMLALKDAKQTARTNGRAKAGTAKKHK